MYTADGLSTSAIKLTLDGDQFGDTERKHIPEKVCYLVIDNPNVVAQKSGLIKDLSNDKLTQKELKLYPNPTNGTLNINGVKANSNYEIIMITGAKICQGVIGSVLVNIEDIAKEIYWIRIIVDAETHTRKIVKR